MLKKYAVQCIETATSDFKSFGRSRKLHRSDTEKYSDRMLHAL